MNASRDKGGRWLCAGGLAAVVRALVLGVVVLVVVPGCASLRFAGAAGLQITCNVPEASLFIDDVYLGPVSEWQVEGRLIKPGNHRIEVRHPDHYAHYAEVSLAAGDNLHLEIVLHRLLD